jgi:hypothetical protein
LCSKCPNRSCEPILNIYVAIAFQWYKELFNPMGFDPWNWLLKIWESTKTPTPKVETPLRVWGFIPSHFPSLSGFLLAHNLASPCFGREPKVRVATLFVNVQNCSGMQVKMHSLTPHTWMLKGCVKALGWD